jgi:hypothetical protein
MLSGWRKYGDVNQIKEGDTVLFEMLNPSLLKVSVISHGAPMPRAAKAKRKRLHNSTESDDDDDYNDGGPSMGPTPGGTWQQQQQAAAAAAAVGMHSMAPSAAAQQLSQQPAQSQRPHSPSAGQQHSPSARQRAAQQAATLSPFEAAGQQAGAPGFSPLDPREAGGQQGQMGPGASSLAPLLQLPQRQATTHADQLAAALTAVQQLELPPAELLALMHGHSNGLTDLAPLPSTDLLALMQQQMMQAGSGGNGSGEGAPAGLAGPGGSKPGSGALVPGLAPLQPTVAELAAVVNQLE